MTAALDLRVVSDPTTFATAAMQFLLQHEAEHCLLIGLVANAISFPQQWDRPLTFAVVESDGAVVATAIRTPPHQPILSRVTDPAAIPLLVDHFMTSRDVTSVLGPVDVATEFARMWTTRTGERVLGSLPQRIYEVRDVTEPRGVPGRLRMATVDDRELLIQWSQAFVAEAFAGADPVPGQAERSVDARLQGDQSGLALWEDGQPVSMIGYSGPTPDGIRIGPVYTPPDFRRRGYAGALTARLSQLLLDDGRAFCALYTDLDNPTANRIYQEIGYRPVADAVTIRFNPISR